MKLNCQTDPSVAAARQALDEFMERSKKLLLVTESVTADAALPLEAAPTPKRSKFDDLLQASKLGD